MKILYINGYRDDNFERKIYLSWDLNLRSPVLRTGILTIGTAVYNKENLVRQETNKYGRGTEQHS